MTSISDKRMIISPLCYYYYLCILAMLIADLLERVVFSIQPHIL